MTLRDLWDHIKISLELWSEPATGVTVAKNPPAVQETPVQSLGQEDPLVEEMATHSIILAWKIPGTEDPGGL